MLDLYARDRVVELDADEQALMTTIAGLVVVLVIVVQEISGLFSLIKALFGF